MHLILTGATGLVGTAVLDSMLSNAAVSRISILSRRPVAMADGHAKATVIIHDDFTSYDASVLKALSGAQGCVWALGVSQNQVDSATYFKITHDYALAAARAFAKLPRADESKPFSFVYVSGEGATQTPGMLTPQYGRVKGQAEAALCEFGRGQSKDFRVVSPRPAGVDWTAHKAIHAYMPRQATYKRVLMEPLKVVYRSFTTPTQPMGRLFTELAMGQHDPLKGSDVELEGTVLTNHGIRRLCGL